ncbi:MAG: hypothetical protein ACJAS4_001329 [Bacteriovoracaceae bacterium]
MSQECTLGELFEKRYAAKIKKGVVGTMGNTAPISPKRTDIQPSINKIVLRANFAVIS